MGWVCRRIRQLCFMASSLIAGYNTIIRRIPCCGLSQALLAGREAQECDAYGSNAHEAEFVICDQPIEIWLSILVRKLLKRGSFRSVEELEAKVLEFIAYYNERMAKPFAWTYQGKALVA